MLDLKIIPIIVVMVIAPSFLSSSYAAPVFDAIISDQFVVVSSSVPSEDYDGEVQLVATAYGPYQFAKPGPGYDTIFITKHHIFVDKETLTVKHEEAVGWYATTEVKEAVLVYYSTPTNYNLAESEFVPVDNTIVEDENEIVTTVVSIVSPKDENGAPSQSGMNTRDAERVSFENADDVKFVMSTTEIKILAGKAFDRYTPVFIDGQHIATIDAGYQPSGKTFDQWVSIGGQTIDIPFEVYYTISQEGRLYRK